MENVTFQESNRGGPRGQGGPNLGDSVIVIQQQAHKGVICIVQRHKGPWTMDHGPLVKLQKLTSNLRALYVNVKVKTC